LSKPIDPDELHDLLIKWLTADKWEVVGENDEKNEQEPISIIKIKGVNVNKGVAMTGGTLENYIMILDTFYKDGVEKLKEINTCLHSDNIPLYTIYVHALKSAAANIGAESLSEAALVLEEAGGEGNIPLIKSKSTQLLADLEELLFNINTVLTKANDREHSTPVDMESIKDELLRLKEAIDSFDSESIKECTDTLHKLTHVPDIGVMIDDILRHVLIGDDEKVTSLIASIV